MLLLISSPDIYWVSVTNPHSKRRHQIDERVLHERWKKFTKGGTTITEDAIKGETCCINLVIYVYLVKGQVAKLILLKKNKKSQNFNIPLEQHCTQPVFF